MSYIWDLNNLIANKDLTTDSPIKTRLNRHKSLQEFISISTIFASKTKWFIWPFSYIQPRLVDYRSNGWRLNPSTSDASPQQATFGCLVRSIWMYLQKSNSRTKGGIVQVCACGRSSQWPSSHSFGWRTARWSTSWSQGSDSPNPSSARPQCTRWCPTAGPTSHTYDPSSPSSLAPSGRRRRPFSATTRSWKVF